MDQPENRATGWTVPVAAAAVALTLALVFVNLDRVLPVQSWLAAFRTHDIRSAQELLFLWSALPRVAISMLCGAALAFSGAVFQQCLRNSLAEPTTLGTSAGAQTGLLVALVWFPGLLDYGQGIVAVAGAGLATLLVFSIARGTTASPLSIILSGLIVNLTLGTLCAVTVLFHPDQTEDLLQWQTGRLEQNSWSPVLSLLPWCIICMVGIGALARPLGLLDMGDGVAKSLGLRIALLRPLALLAAIVLAGSVVATVGLIGFIGLGVPALARVLGARRFLDRLITSAWLGAMLLLLADQIVQLPFVAGGLLPTGVVATLIGAPVLLLLLPGLKRRGVAHAAGSSGSNARRFGRYPATAIVALALALIAVCLFLGRGPTGWEWTDDPDFVNRWRTARVIAAISAGMLLGCAGTLIQRITGNPMASPEVMGISSGATLGAIVLVTLSSAWTPASLLAASTSGALAVTILVVLLAWRGRFSAEHIVLAGVALSSVVGALAAVLIAGGGPVRGLLLTWLSGSTYRVTTDEAIVVGLVAACAISVLPALHRWLDILPLGEPSARALGVGIPLARGAIIIACALATAAATLVVGPSSFIGLLAPQLVRSLGFNRARPQLFAAALAGGAIMLLADWLGRMLIFPWQIPAGLLATLVGGPFFLLLIYRRA